MDKTPKIWLDEKETIALLEVAKKNRYRDYLILTLCRYGLRDGEILGRGKLPGIYVRDLRDNGIWMIGKGYSHEGEAPSVYPLSTAFAKELIEFSVKEGGGKDRKLFDLSVRQLSRLIKAYAKEAGIKDWLYVRPHRLRAFFRDRPESKRLSSISDPGHDETQEHNDDKPLRGKNAGIVKTSGHGDAWLRHRFFLLGPVVLALFTHAYLTLTGSFSGLYIVEYQSSQIFAYLEGFVTIVLTPVFLWKLVVYWHDRPFSPRHAFDDPGILD